MTTETSNARGEAYGYEHDGKFWPAAEATPWVIHHATPLYTAPPPAAAPPSAPVGVMAVREAFEDYIAKDSGDLSTFGFGRDIHYSNSAVNNAWDGWKAGAKWEKEQHDRLLNEAREAHARAETLQAEVETWKALHASEVQVRQRWQARAERLAHALRLAVNRNGAGLLLSSEQLTEFRAALHPTAAQENDDA